MAEYSQQPLPPPGGPAAGALSPGTARGRLRVLLVTLAIVVGGAVLGIAGGLVWAAIAPRALFVVASHGVAYVVNPETSAFIAADGWFSVVAVVGGAVIGLGGYLLGVRRFGPVPAAGVLAGATAAAFLAWWTGSSLGVAAFRHRLGTSKPGVLLRQPIDLGAHGAVTFWPLAAGAVVGGIELMMTMRGRQHDAEPGLAGPVPPQPYGLPPPPSGPAQHNGQDGPGAPGGPGVVGGQPGQRPTGQPQAGWRPDQAGWSSDQYD
jgi:hypothetical protein